MIKGWQDMENAMKNRTIIQNSIITDMSEGVMAIRFDGKIVLVNYF